MEMIFLGYFPKRTALRPPWINAPDVDEIASMSECISAGPPGWVNHWLHNDHWLFDSPEIARSILGDEAGAFDIYAFKQAPILIDKGEVVQISVAPAERADRVTPLSEQFRFLGYDAVSRSLGTTFECSPLSCNNAATEMKTNRYCLFETYAEALNGAIEFSQGTYEPGPYYVVEVYRQSAAFVSEPSFPIGEAESDGHAD